MASTPSYLRFEESPAERLSSILATIDTPENVDDEAVAAFHDELLDLFDAVRAGEVEGIDRADVDTLRQIADAAQALAALASERLTAAAEREAEIAELEAVIRPAVEAAEAEAAEETAEPVAEETPADEPVAETPEVEADADTLEPVAAATRPAPGAIRTPAQPRRAAPVASGPAESKILVNGVEGDVAALVAALSDRINATRGPVNHTDRITVGQAIAEYPEALTLSGVDADGDANRIEAVVAAASRVGYWNDLDPGLVASIGWCAPTEIEYERIRIGQTQRPVRDSLPSFNARRGGVRLPAPLKLTDIDVTGSDAAVSKWTEGNDIAGTSKPIQEIDCVDFTEYKTYAVTKRLRFNNMGQRAYPENVAAWFDVTNVAHAQLGEVLLLDAIRVLSDREVSTDINYGAARDLAEAMIRAATGIRHRHRAPDLALRVWAPWWVVQLGAADLIRSEGNEAYAEKESTFRSWLAGAGVNVSFFYDHPTAQSGFAPEVDGSLLDAWPSRVGWGIADEGHFLFLDGGAEDFGIVRDSTLNAVNKAELFAETFEGIAKRGVESLWVESNVCVDGTYAGGVIDGVTCSS